MAHVAEVTSAVAAVMRLIAAGLSAMAAGDGYIADEWSRPTT
jgi:hypothetical protein